MTQPSAVGPTANAWRRLAARGLVRDLLVAALLLASGGVWGTAFWKTWVTAGGQPMFYQIYFEPAVMVACGKGFVVSQRQPKAVEDFLFQRRDSFDCRELAPDLKVGREQLFQEAWTYLQITVGVAWWVLGISWSGMGPLFGLFFGGVIALSYGVFRLGMGRPLAVFAAGAFAVSSTHLLNLPHLRDYSKAPFTLALVLILGITVTRPVRSRNLLLLAAAYGAVLGVGYGFRTDFLALLPVMVIVLYGFVEGGVTRNLLVKTAATVLLVVTFVTVSWPASSAVYKKGGCQWHVALLGLQAPFDEDLRVAPAPYDFGYAYADGYVRDVVDGYTRRMDPDSAVLEFCSHEYDVQSGAYLRDIVTQFPADLITRSYASVLQIVELPLRGGSVPPIAGMAPWLYDLRAQLLQPTHRWGAIFTGLAVLMAGAVSIRLSLFLLFFLAYFGGYPAIQFQERHHFHLEFMGWWAAGFVVQQAITAAGSLRKGFPDARPFARSGALAASIGATAIVLGAGALAGARWYQGNQTRELLRTYIAAPQTPIATPASPLPDVAPRAWPQFLEVDLDEAACGPSPAVTFRYSPDDPGRNYTRTITIRRRASTEGLTRIFLPVYDRFIGLQISDDSPGCLAGASRVEVGKVPVLLGAVLQPDWEAKAPLYQRLIDWEADPLLPPFQPLPDVKSWGIVPGVTLSRTLLGALVVQGEAASGVQLTSPAVAAEPGTRVSVRANLRLQRGLVCVGALNQGGAKWLAPAGAPSSVLTFTVDDSGGFMVAIANCNPDDNPQPTSFKFEGVEYLAERAPRRRSGSP